MTGAITAEFQAARPEFDELYAEMGQMLRVFKAQAATSDPGAQPLPEYDERGELVTPPAPDPTPTTPGAGTAVGTYPCIAYQLDAKDKADLGADMAVPLWEVVAHWSAPLHDPGLLFEVFGGELPKPLLLSPLGDIVDEGTQRLCWTFTARAPEGRSV
ncbi:hypothetical protein GO986_08600 [Deinococcus sp. HMF7620]|uniref:Uncharacterized protein n=1 Tax=Deinococcus arboris TaxID=2682977 RepID=A0A7C9LQS5_9DEIO|nr:hypothetical protein [Deinococcus arboris]MVN86821.1 hypothetical protein [Deinococcus arboris]